MKKLKSGFTLIEMLVVVAIVGILSTVVYSSYSRYISNAKFTVCQSELYSIIECFETSMVQNESNQVKGDEVTPESFTTFEELMTLDLVSTYNYISDINLPSYVTLTVSEANILYVNSQEGIELTYDPQTRAIISSIKY